MNRWPIVIVLVGTSIALILTPVRALSPMDAYTAQTMERQANKLFYQAGGSASGTQNTEFDFSNDAPSLHPEQFPRYPVSRDVIPAEPMTVPNPALYDTVIPASSVERQQLRQETMINTWLDQDPLRGVQF